jgi:hypothetical protein
LIVFCFILDILAQLYAFIKCLKAGIHQSILPNRGITKVQQQSMDLLHRIGDATIVDFADPGFLTELESIQQDQLTASEIPISISKDLPTPPKSSIINGEKLKRSKSMVSKSSPGIPITGDEKLKNPYLWY